jgi:predicted ester cyclase
MANQDVIRRMFDEVINQGRVDLIDELFDPDFVSETPQGTMDRDGFRQYILDWRAGFSDVHCEVGDFVEEGDKIAWSVRATGTHDGPFMGIPATGRSVDFASLNTATMRDGRGLHHQVVMDTLTMLTQLGVIPDLSSSPT